MAVAKVSRTEECNDPAASCSSANLVGTPLDMSFRCLMSSNELIDEAKSQFQRNIRRSPDTGKLLCSALRLNNNSLSDLSDFSTTLEEIFDNPLNLGWLDISFNEFHTIDDIITKYKNLRVLYLHGNGIEKIQEIKKLTTLPHLRNLTLHGNPIEQVKGYRQYVLSILPGLKTLDFSGVTKQDRATAVTWCAMNKQVPKKKQKPTE